MFRHLRLIGQFMQLILNCHLTGQLLL